MSPPPLLVRSCGPVEYADALRAMTLHRDAIAQGSDSDTLLLVEHPPVFTLGRGATRDDILWSDTQLSERGVEVHDTDRGGEITCHAPGQLVAYPLVALPADRRDVRKWVRSLEDALIRTCARLDVTADRLDGFPGVWLREGPAGDRKIAALGVHLNRWVSTHGVALNVTNDLSLFTGIVPCGLRDKGVTSLQREGIDSNWHRIADLFAQSLCEVLGRPAQPVSPELPTVQVVIVNEHRDVLVLRRTPARGGFWQTVTGRAEAGETSLETAMREVAEETGLHATPIPLEWVHDFPLDPTLRGLPVRRVGWARETAFMARVEGTPAPTLAPDEHDAWEWLPLDAALERVPFAGTRQAIRLATGLSRRPPFTARIDSHPLRT